MNSCLTIAYMSHYAFGLIKYALFNIHEIFNMAVPAVSNYPPHHSLTFSSPHLVVSYVNSSIMFEPDKVSEEEDQVVACEWMYQRGNVFYASLLITCSLTTLTVSLQCCVGQPSISFSSD